MTRVHRRWMRGAGPLAVLELLDARTMYGYELAEALDRTSEGVLAMGHSTLYPLLYNLEEKGLVEVGETRVIDGRERKYYRVTEAGRAHLEERRAEWSGLVRAMARLGVS